MAFLFTAEFSTGADGQPAEDGAKMLEKIKQALKNITGGAAARNFLDLTLGGRPDAYEQIE